VTTPEKSVPRECALHPALEVRASRIEGRGLFATASIAEMACNCRSSLCRGTVTGLDWQRPELQARYGEHWVPVLRERIRSQRPDSGAEPRR